ncbi:MAG: TonB-dependent receptor [Gemmatimonadetes bacterium]|nr:TonB-dependent receptor [Gemmatimonadota bacterium]
MFSIRSSIVRAAFLIAALVPAQARAQQPADTFALNELVVTATRLPLPRAAVPAAVTVLDGDELRARGVRFVADALKEVPGAAVVRTGSDGGVTSLFLRGGESDYVQVLVDGIVVNDPGGAFDLGHLTLDDVERIEVVRGPVSVLYGSDAVTGVVHVITRRGEGPARLFASAGAGFAGRRSGDAAACPGFPLAPCPEGADLGFYATRGWEASVAGSGRRLRYSVGGSGLDSDGAYAFNNAYRNRSAVGRLGVAGSAGEATLSARYTDGLYHYPTDGAGRLDDRNAYHSSESLALGLDAGRALGRAVELRAAVSYHDGDYETVDERDAAGDTLGFYASTSTSRVDRRKADVHANLRAGAAVATLGLELERQHGASDFTSRSQFGPFESSTSNDRSNRALYGQLFVAPASRVSATAGLRREDNDRFGAFVTWRAGANVRVTASTSARASAGTAFKEPTFFENFAEGFTRGNPELEPERSRSWEMGLVQALPAVRGELSATWFDQRFENLIQYSSAPASGAPNYVNVGAATSRGLELEAHVGSAGGARATASWVHLLTEVVDAGLGADRLFQQGQALIRRPRERVSVAGSAPLGARVRAGGRATAVGKRDDLDFIANPSGARVVLPAYEVVDAFVEVALLARTRTRGPGGRDLALRISVENALDRDYREIANFPASGRALSAALLVGSGL